MANGNGSDPTLCGDPVELAGSTSLLFGDPLPMSPGTPLLLSTQNVASPEIEAPDQQPVEANEELSSVGIGELCDRFPWVVVIVFVAAFLLARRS